MMPRVDAGLRGEPLEQRRRIRVEIDRVGIGVESRQRAVEVEAAAAGGGRRGGLAISSRGEVTLPSLYCRRHGTSRYATRPNQVRVPEGSCCRLSRISDAQANTSRPATTRRSRRIRSRRSCGGISIACRSAAREPGAVVGVDDEGVLQLLRGAGQLAQHEHAVLVVTRRDELLRDEVHAVVQRADDAEVGELVERDEAPQDQRVLAIADRAVRGTAAVADVDAATLASISCSSEA